MFSQSVVLFSDKSSNASLVTRATQTGSRDDLLDLVTDGYVLLDQQHKITHASSKAELWLNQEMLALLGEYVWQFLPKQVAKLLSEQGSSSVSEDPVANDARWLHSVYGTCLKVRLAPYCDGFILSFHEENKAILPVLDAFCGADGAVSKEAEKDNAGLAMRDEVVAETINLKDASIATLEAWPSISEKIDSTYKSLPHFLRQQIFLAEENERRRIARELHDVLGQYVTALRFGLENLSYEIGEYRNELTGLMKMRSLIEQFDQEFHHVALELRPPTAANGLKGAIVQYALEWGERAGVHVDLHAPDGKLKLSEEKETALYRILQESLNNTQKYAKAKRVSIILEKRSKHVQLVIEDNGQGFDIEAYQRGQERLRKIGLASMKERASLLGGVCEIESNLGHGTTIFVRVPVTE